MKRAYLFVTVLAAMVALGSFAAYADDDVIAPVTAGPNFIDENGDGICDINPDGVKQQLRDGSGNGVKKLLRDGSGNGVKQELRDGSGAGKGGGSDRRGGRSGK